MAAPNTKTATTAPPESPDPAAAAAAPAEREIPVVVGYEDLEARILAIEAELATLRPVPASAPPEGTVMEAAMFPIVRCPECQLPLQGQSPTGPQAQYFQHPFETSPKTGKACSFKGKKFSPPKVLLHLAP